MRATEKRPFAHAMAFYHQDGLPAAWQQAMRFAGKGGRLATMPDIIAARIESKPGDVPWETWYTTLTAEYYGLSKQGKRILIVAHGIGPLSTLDGIRQAYSWEYKDKERRRRGGRITEHEFWDLEAGKHGKVEVVDFEAYCRRYRYPFIQTLRASEAFYDPLLEARFGPQAREYVYVHANHARAWHRQQIGIDPENKYNFENFDRFLDCRRRQHAKDGVGPAADPYIIQMGGAANCPYPRDRGDGRGYRPIESGYAVAHLISTGRLCHLHHEGNESLTLDVGCHEWGNGVRLVGIQAGGGARAGIQAGPDAYNLLRKHWRDLLLPMKGSAEIGFRALVKIGNQWFTQYPKQGAGMDTHEPEYVVTKIEKIGKPALFRTEIVGYHGFFKFDTKDVRTIAPPGANTYYFVSEPQNEWHDGNTTHQTCKVQFYRIEADMTKRLMRSDQLAHDYATMMSLMAK